MKAFVIMQEELFAGCRTQPGFVCTKADLSADAKNFRYSGVFQDIQVRTVEKDDKVHHHHLALCLHLRTTKLHAEFHPPRCRLCC